MSTLTRPHRPALLFVVAVLVGFLVATNFLISHFYGGLLSIGLGLILTGTVFDSRVSRANLVLNLVLAAFFLVTGLTQVF